MASILSVKFCPNFGRSLIKSAKKLDFSRSSTAHVGMPMMTRLKLSFLSFETFFLTLLGRFRRTFEVRCSDRSMIIHSIARETRILCLFCNFSLFLYTLILIDQRLTFRLTTLNHLPLQSRTF